MAATTSTPTRTSNLSASAPRFRGAWTPVLHDPSPHVPWSFEVRNASNVLHGLTDNIRVKPYTPTSKSAKQLTTPKTAKDTTSLSPAEAAPSITTTPSITSIVNENNSIKSNLSSVDENKEMKEEAATANAAAVITATKVEAPPAVVEEVKSEAVSETPKKEIEVSSSTSQASSDLHGIASSMSSLNVSHDHDHHHEDDHAHHDVHIEEHKVEEHNKSVTQLATTLVEYEMTHGEVEAANKRVADIMNKYKGVISEDEIVTHIIKSKCIQAALVGLVIGGCATIPALGSIAAIIVGAAADGALTTKIQVDMMLEIGCALGHYEKLKDNKYRKERLLLAAGLIKSGVDANGKDIFIDSASNDPFTSEAGHRVSEKALEEFGKRSFLYFIPVVGAVTASATDLSWTYVIGRRAETIFRTGEKDLPTWSESVFRHTGVDSTALSNWLIEAFELPRRRVIQKMKQMSSTAMATLRKYTSTPN